jgi:ATP-dependent Clp protease protease subunit
MNRPKLFRTKPKPTFRAALQPDGTLELLVYEDIGEDWWSGGGVTAKTIKQEIDQAGPFTKISVRINSPGGDAFEGVAIYNVLRAQGKPIAVFVDGIAASAASVVAMAGDTRVMGSGAMLMIHNAWSSCVGYAEDMRKMADVLDKVSTSVAETYITRAGMTADKAKELMDAESWLGAAESVALGLATGIAEPEPEDASAMALARSFKALTRLKKVPEVLKQQDDDPDDAVVPCSCVCNSCVSGVCSECNCAGCDASNCEAAACNCGQTAEDQTLTIFEAELEAIEFGLRVSR